MFVTFSKMCVFYFHVAQVRRSCLSYIKIYKLVNLKKNFQHEKWSIGLVKTKHVYKWVLLTKKQLLVFQFTSVHFGAKKA